MQLSFLCGLALGFTQKDCIVIGSYASITCTSIYRKPMEVDDSSQAPLVLLRDLRPTGTFGKLERRFPKGRMTKAMGSG